MCRRRAAVVALLIVAAGARSFGQSASPPALLPAAATAKAEELPAKAAVEPAGAERPAYLLTYRFAPGQVVRYEVTQSMEITTRKDQTSETVSNESKAWKHLKVVEVDDDGSATLELTIDRVQMSARFGEADPVVFDSEKSEKAPRQFTQVKESVGKPHGRVKVSPNGHLLSAVRLIGGGEPAKPAAGGEADQMMNVLIEFPKHPLTVGETWKDDPAPTVRVSVSKSLSRNVEILRKYRLASVDGSLATIEVASAVLTPVNDPSMRAQLIQRTPEGTIVFDIDKGQIVSRHLKSDKTEIGVFGDNSLMRAVSDRLETLTPEQVAEKTE